MAASGFVLYQPLYEKIDAITLTFITQVTGKTIAAVAPVVTVALTLLFIAYGLAVMRNAIDMPLSDFLMKSLKVGLIVSVALTGGMYQSEIAQVIFKLPDDFAATIMTLDSSSTGVGAAQLVDECAGQGFAKAQEAFSKAGIFADNGFTYGFIGVIIIIATAVMSGIGGAFLLMAKVALGVLCALGPMFIVCLLFKPVYRFFVSWVNQCVNYFLLIVLFAAVFSLLMNVYGNYMEDLRFAKGVNLGYAVGGCTIISIVSIIIMLQLPKIASGLAGGAAMADGNVTPRSRK